MKIGIFGTGAYGMALASVLSKNNIDITMWTKFEEEKNELIENKGNEKLLPGFKLNDNIKVTTDILECSKDKDFIIIVIPVPFITDLCVSLSSCLDKNTGICIASKGIENDKGLFINEIVNKYFNTEKIAVISGPSFAKDMIIERPIGLTLATKNDDLKADIIKAFDDTKVKLETSDDVIGIEVCGSIKNVFAIASGMLEGLNASDSTRALLVTEALSDIGKMIKIFGGSAKTILTYAGIGDLVLTCTSSNSRNYSFGKLIGAGASKEEVDNYLSNTTVEGYNTLKSVYKLLQERSVEIQSIKLLYDIITFAKEPEDLLNFLIKKEQ